MRKSLLLWLSLLIFPMFSTGQTISEALLFSQSDVVGTARTVGVGGSFGAMGGDYSSIIINPAGLGEYKKSEFTITPSYVTNSTTAYFVANQDKTSSRSTNNINLDNAAIVFSQANPLGSKLLNSNFAIGFNRVNSYNADYSVNGKTLGSITERFIEMANGLNLDDLNDFEAGLAYDAYALIGPDEFLGYGDDFEDIDETNKLQIINQSGSLNEISVAWAGNIQNKFNIGVSLGVPVLKYRVKKNYRQSYVDNARNNTLNYYQNNEIDGTGVNLKIGATYKPINALRLGFAVHTPTAFVLENEYYATMNYRYDNGPEDNGAGESESPLGTFKYAVATPLKFVSSVGTIFKTGDIAGFVNLDWEHIDYSKVSYNLSAYSDVPEDLLYSDELNEEINNRLTSVNNIKVGMELAYDVMRLRGGYNMIYSGYNGEEDVQNAWSLGLGYSGDKYFIDVAYRKFYKSEGYSPYYLKESSRDPLATVDSDIGRLMMTVGFRM